MVDEVDIEISTGIDNQDLNTEISVYPNPSNGILNIINAENSEISIYNILGTKVYTLKNTDKQLSIDSQNFAKGTYIIKIKNDNEITTKRVIFN